jgi:hypothetical protein
MSRLILSLVFEFNPYPDVNPNFETDTVVVDGACQAYSVAIPAQPASNTYSSYLMYIIENDIPVTVNDVVIGGDVPTCAAELIQEPVAETPLNFQETSAAAGFTFSGLDCIISTVKGEVDTCATASPVVDIQAVYVSESLSVIVPEATNEDGEIIPAYGEKIIKIAYASDKPNTTGIGFKLHFDSSVLSVKEVTNVYDGAIASGTVTNEDDDSDDGNELTDQFLAFGWASLFGQFPGSQTVELATITFTHDLFESTSDDSATDDSSSDDSAETPASDDSSSDDSAETPASDDSSSDDSAETPASDDSSSDDSAETPASDDSSSDDSAETPASDDSSSDDSVDAPADPVVTVISVPEQAANTQHVYVSDSQLSEDVSQVTVTLSYKSDNSSTTGVGFAVNFDSGILSLNNVSEVANDAIAPGNLNAAGDGLDFGFASLFGNFPGSNEAILAKVTFDIDPSATDYAQLDLVGSSNQAGMEYELQSQQIAVVAAVVE